MSSLVPLSTSTSSFAPSEPSCLEKRGVQITLLVCGFLILNASIILRHRFYPGQISSLLTHTFAYGMIGSVIIIGIGSAKNQDLAHFAFAVTMIVVGLTAFSSGVFLFYAKYNLLTCALFMWNGIAFMTIGCLAKYQSNLEYYKDVKQFFSELKNLNQTSCVCNIFRNYSHDQSYVETALQYYPSFAQAKDSNGDTALFIFAQETSFQTLKSSSAAYFIGALEKAGVDFYAPNAQGQTPLEIAICRQHYDAVSNLLIVMDPLQPDHKGNRPLDYAYALLPATSLTTKDHCGILMTIASIYDSALYQHGKAAIETFHGKNSLLDDYMDKKGVWSFFTLKDEDLSS